MTDNSTCSSQGVKLHPCKKCGKPTYHNATKECLCGKCAFPDLVFKDDTSLHNSEGI